MNSPRNHTSEKKSVISNNFEKSAIKFEGKAGPIYGFSPCEDQSLNKIEELFPIQMN